MKRFLWVLSGILSALSFVVAGSASPAHADSVSYIQSKTALPIEMNYRVPEKSNNNIKSTSKIGNSIYFDENCTTNGITVNGLQYHLNSAVDPGDIISFSISVYMTNNAVLQMNYYGLQSPDYQILRQDVSQVDENKYYIFVVAQRNLGIGSSDTVNFNFAAMNTPIFHVYAGAGVSVARVTTSSFGIAKPVSGTSLQQAINAIIGGLKIDADTSGLSTSDKQDDIIAGINAGNQQAHQDSQAQLQEQQKQTAEAEKQTAIQEEQKNFVTDTSTPDASDIANSDSIPSSGLLPDGPLDSLLLLPVNMLNSIIQSLGGTCSPIDVPVPFVDDKITFPCFNTSVYQGSFEVAANIVGGVGSAFMLYGYFKYLYSKIDRAVSLDSTEKDEWGIM